jgi:hypothetical protein
MTTPEQIQAWAREAGFVSAEFWPDDFKGLQGCVERFAHLARADLEAENADLTAQMADQGPYINKLRDKINSLRNELFAVRVHGKHEATKRVLAKLSELKALFEVIDNLTTERDQLLADNDFGGKVYKQVLAERDEYQVAADKLAMENLELRSQLALQAAQPVAPHECKTEAEKLAYAAGWWKALEVNRAQPVGTVESAAIGAGGFHVLLTKGEAMPNVGTPLYAALQAVPAEPLELMKLLDAADAARYRWLRDHKGNNRVPHISQYPFVQQIDEVQMPYFTTVGLDAAVDAAMKETP